MTSLKIPSRFKNPIVLALALAGVWVLLLAAFSIALGDLEKRWSFGVFLGRFHILIVHLPIGLLAAALAMEALGRLRIFPGLENQVLPLLWMGFLGAIAATLAGYLLMTSDRYEGTFMTRHLWSGLAVVVLSLSTLILHLVPKFPAPAYLASLTLTVLTVGMSSHYGGNMVHGETYLSQHAPDFLKPLLGHPGDPASEENAVDDRPVEQLVIYDHIIQPIFDAKCVDCHNENKVKGGLRMDSFDQLAAGGDIGEEFIPGDAEGSELYYRVTLPPDDIDFMPPDDEEPMTPDEVLLLGWWINQGASPSMTIGEAERASEVDEALQRWLDIAKSETAGSPPNSLRNHFANDLHP